MYVNADIPVNCVFTARLRGRITHESLTCALDRIQQRHPLLQASIHEDRRRRPYFTANVTTPPIPIDCRDRLSDDHWLTVSEAEWKRPFDLKKGPLARIVWLRDTNVSELLIVSPHCVADGMTCITLLRELLEGLDKPAGCRPGYVSFTHLHDIIPASVLAGRRAPNLRKTLTTLVAQTFFNLKPAPRFIPTGKDYVLHWKLNAKATGLLEEHCRAQGVSVYAALCVAFLESFIAIRNGRGRNKLLCPVDIRKMVPAIKDDMMFAFAPIIELSIRSEQGRKHGDQQGGQHSDQHGDHQSGQYSREQGRGQQDAAGFWDKARQIKKEITQKVTAIDPYEMLLSGENFQPCARKLINLRIKH